MWCGPLLVLRRSFEDDLVGSCAYCGQEQQAREGQEGDVQAGAPLVEPGAFLGCAVHGRRWGERWVPMRG